MGELKGLGDFLKLILDWGPNVYHGPSILGHLVVGLHPLILVNTCNEEYTYCFD